MKIFSTYILVLLSLFGQSQIEAIIDIKKFHSNKSNYIETYLFVFGNTLYESRDTSNTENGIEVFVYRKSKQSDCNMHHY